MSIRLVILIVCVVFLDNTHSNRELVRWIHSPRITTWGTWGQPHFCPYNSWVGGMTLKIDTSQGWRSDDTALNGVQLHCVNLDWIHTGNITSSVGSWGNYRKTKYCPRGYATGYQLRSEKNEAIDDDVGAVDFKLKCTNFDGTISYVINSEYALPWGQWSPEQNCPPQTVVCGISTQVESNQGDGLQDDTSLNNVDLACCKIPDPAETCKLETKWETVTICSEAKKQCELKFATSIVNDEQQLKYAKFYERLGFIVDFLFVQKKLMLRSKLSGLSITSGKSLESIIGETEVKETKILTQINCEGIIQQLIVACGSYNVYTKEYRCVPNGVQGRFMIHLLSYFYDKT